MASAQSVKFPALSGWGGCVQEPQRFRINSLTLVFMKKLIACMLAAGLLLANELMSQDKKTLQTAKTYFTWVDQGKTHHLNKLLAEDFSGNISFDVNPLDKAGWKAMMESLKAAFPDMKHEFQAEISEKDKVALKGLLKGTNNGNYMGQLPTNKAIALPFSAVLLFNQKGKLSTISMSFDPRVFDMQMVGEGENRTGRAKQTITGFFAAIDAGETDRFSEFCAPNFKVTSPLLSGESDLAVFQSNSSILRLGFPDMKHEITRMEYTGTHVMTTGVFRGTNSGPYSENLATNRKVEFPFLVLDELDAKYKISNRWIMFDGQSFNTQLYEGYSQVLENLLREMFAASDAGDVDKVVSYWDEYGKSNYNGAEHSMDELKTRLKNFKKSFPDIQRTIDAVTVCGNRAHVRGTVSGTQSGPYMGKPATNRRATIGFMAEYLFNGKGKIEAGWTEVDFGALNDQLFGKKR
jgi:predicted ester cyclase